MKTLIVIGHPNLEKSIIHKRWIEELRKHPDVFTIHDLHASYPDYEMDIEKEQKLVDSHDNLVLQYPLYWFNVPALLKKWMDDVFIYGWAYGSSGNALKNKKIAIAMSAGIKKEDYTKNGKMGITISELLVPFGVTIRYCKAIYKGEYVLYDTHNALKENFLENSAVEYVNFLKNASML